MPYAKFLTALAGAAATSAIVAFGGSSTIGKLATILAAVATAAAVYWVPNTPAPEGK